MKDNAYFCPACGTASLEKSMLAGGGASCKVCPWTGTVEELTRVPLEHAFASQEEMLHTFIKQLASTIAKSAALATARVLLQWGFLDKETMNADLQMYLRSMAVASAKAAIETRRHLEVVRANKLRANDVS